MLRGELTLKERKNPEQNGKQLFFFFLQETKEEKNISSHVHLKVKVVINLIWEDQITFL